MKEETKNKIEELAKRRLEIAEEIEQLKKEDEKWEPSAGSFGLIFNSLEPSKMAPWLSRFFIEFGFGLPTKESAERFSKYIKFHAWLFKLADDLNEGWEPDWCDEDQPKYVIMHTKRASIPQWSLAIFSLYRHDYMSPVFKDSETVEKAIEIINNDERFQLPR